MAAGPGALRQLWQRRWLAWWQSRHPPSPSTTLVQRNVYIVPTPAGWLYGLLLLALLLGSINYQLNLGHLLTFVLAGAGVVALHATHATLRGLCIARVGSALRQGHVGDVMELPLQLIDTRARGRLARAVFLGRHGITLTWSDAPALSVDGPESRAGRPLAQCEATPAWTPSRRAASILARDSSSISFNASVVACRRSVVCWVSASVSSCVDLVISAASDCLESSSALFSCS